jgi:hypothetical protein
MPILRNPVCGSTAGPTCKPLIVGRAQRTLQPLLHCRVPWTAMPRATQPASVSDFTSECVPSQPASRPPMPEAS